MMMPSVRCQTVKVLRCVRSCLSVRLFNTGRMPTNHYDALGLPKTASKKEIRLAYLQLSKQYHPDTRKDGPAKTTDKFHQIREAYDVLSDEKKKAEYDYNLLRNDRQNMPSMDHPLSQFYADGTIYTEPKDSKGKRRVNRFTNGQLVCLTLLFALIGGLVQVAIIRYFAKKRLEEDERIHREASTHLRNVHKKALQGRTELQLRIAEYKLTHKNKEKARSSTNTEALVDMASTTSE